MTTPEADSTPTWSAPTFDELVAEQSQVQSHKLRERTLGGYEIGHIFVEQFLFKNGAAISETLGLLHDQAGRVPVTTIPKLLSGMAESRGRAIHWADMGAGYAVALRQVGADASLRERVRRTAVDLSYPELSKGGEKYEALSQLLPELFTEDAEPDFIQGNIEEVALPAQADLITSIYALQYLNDPLRAICNWYNQLSPGGLMVVGDDTGFSSHISFHEAPVLSTGPTPLELALRALGSAGVRYATNGRYVPQDNAWNYDLAFARIIAVQKEPDTLLRLGTAVMDVTADEFGKKSVFYQAADKPVEVVGL